MAFSHNYDYAAQIKSPQELGMSDDGDALASDVSGLLGYAKVLVEGGGPASRVNGPLGDKYFLLTGSKCTNVLETDASKNSVPRSIYINNVSDGDIAFMTGTGLKGLIPSILSSITRISPLEIISSFSNGPSPNCQEITLETINGQNVSTPNKAFVLNSEIAAMPAQWFTVANKRKPTISNFTTMALQEPGQMAQGQGQMAQGQGQMAMAQQEQGQMPIGQMPHDLAVRVYLSMVMLLGLYILYRLFQRKSL